ncbi:MAG: phage tail tape measure protein, partial [Smithella sp.]
MSTRKDVVNLLITVNGDDAKKKFYDLQTQAAGLRSELKGLKKGSDEWIQKSKELDEVEKKMAEVRKEVHVTGLSIQALGKEISRLKGIRNTLDPASAEFKKLSGEIQVAEERMRQLQRGGTTLSRTFDFLKKEAMGFGVVMLGALGIDYVLGKIGNLIQKNAELSDAFSDVRKTTGLSAQEIEEFNKELKGLNTRTPRKELLDLATEAGKLNITGKKNILDFVDTANKIKVALGKDLGEDAVTQITKLSQIFKIQEKNGISLTESLTKVGNVINKIGAESTASEGYLVDFLSRTGPVGAQADMTIQQLTALGSAADQLNLSAEVTATTFNQILPDMFTNTAAYAQVAGMSTGEFARILNTDANEALLKFLEGLNGNNAGLGLMSEKLKDVEIDGTRGIAVLAALAQNTDKIKTALKSANQEFTTGSSMIEEYNLRNSNFAGNIERIKKAMSGWFQSSDMIKFFQNAFGWMAKLLDIPLSKKLEDERLRLYQIEIQLKNTNLKQE